MHEKLEALCRKAFPPEGARWMGWVLLGSLGLALASLLGFIGLGLWVIWAVSKHGAGEVYNTAPLWLLFGMLLGVSFCLLRFWWHFSRGEGPMRVSRGLKAAQAGDPAAMLRVGGTYLEKGDALSARAWTAQAAEAGHAEAMVALGRMLEEGLGGPKDPDAALAWYGRALDFGHPEARALETRLAHRRADRHTL